MAGSAVDVIQSMPTGSDADHTRLSLNKVVVDLATMRGASSDTVTLARELHDDHATFKTAVDQTETLIEELHDDHATFKTAVDQTETLIEEMHDDHATARTSMANLKRVLSNLCLADAGVAIGTTVAKVKFANNITYLIDGEFKAKTATDDFWTLSGTTITDGNTNKYLLCIDAAGAASIVEGTQAASAGAVVLPAWPASKSVVGILTVATAGAEFVPGTTALDAATVTDTYFDGFDPALIGDPPATLTAPKPASAPATLTAPKPASGPATLTAAKPSATAIDEAGDLTAYTVNVHP